MKIPPHSAWYWRKLLKLRALVRPHLKHRIGNGENTYNRFDNWHPGGPIVERYGSRVIDDLGVGKHAKVSVVLNEFSWDWPVPNSWELRELVQETDSVLVKRNSEDTIYWSPMGGKFSSASGYELIKSKGASVAWHKQVWHKNFVPIHSFVLWFAILGKHFTQDKISRFINAHLFCVFRREVGEDHNHLFSDCRFARELWMKAMNFCNESWSPQSWQSTVQ